MTDGHKFLIAGLIAAIVAVGGWYATAVLIIREINQIETNRINIEKLKEATHGHAKNKSRD